MLNTNYTLEIATANQFIIDHNYDAELLDFMRQMKKPFYSHSDRWSKIYDWIAEHYPEATGTLVTGLTYLTEGLGGD